MTTIYQLVYINDAVQALETPSQHNTECYRIYRRYTWEKHIMMQQRRLMVIPEHCRKVQTMAQQEASDFLGLQSTLFQIDEQQRASYTPARPTKSPKKKKRSFTKRGTKALLQHPIHRDFPFYHAWLHIRI